LKAKRRYTAGVATSASKRKLTLEGCLSNLNINDKKEDEPTTFKFNFIPPTAPAGLASRTDKPADEVNLKAEKLIFVNKDLFTNSIIGKNSGRTSGPRVKLEPKEDY